MQAAGCARRCAAPTAHDCVRRCGVPRAEAEAAAGACCRRASIDAAVSHWQRAFSAAACAARVLEHDGRAPVACKWPRQRAVRVHRVPYRVSQHADPWRAVNAASSDAARLVLRPRLPPTAAPVEARRVAALKSPWRHLPRCAPPFSIHVTSTRGAPRRSTAVGVGRLGVPGSRQRGEAVAARWVRFAAHGFVRRPGARASVSRRSDAPPSRAADAPPPARAPPQRQACCSRWRAWSR